jgi:membrane protein
MQQKAYCGKTAVRLVFYGWTEGFLRKLPEGGGRMNHINRKNVGNWVSRQIGRGKLLLEVTHVNKIPLYSASACYFMALAAFPLLVLVLSILRYTPLQVETLIELVDGLVPAALMPWIKHLIHSTYENSSAAILSVSAVVALWSASRSIYGLVIGLNTIYGVKESRNYFLLRGMNMLYMFLFLVVLVLTLVIHVFGKAILSMLPVPEYPFFRFLADVVDSRYLLLLLVQTALFTAMYAALPNKQNPAGECVPGAVLASVGWQGFSAVFSLYVDNFNRYANIYGSVYAVALSMLWLYCCIFIIFLGGAFNRFLAWYRQEKKNK